MAMNQPKSHIIAYDIADTRRLGRIHRYLKKIAVPVQYSVFLIPCSSARLQDIKEDLEQMIDPKKDDIRLYTLPENPDITVMGRQGAAPGIYLLGTGNEYLSRL